jgi:biotin carboxyl carrier protein
VTDRAFPLVEEGGVRHDVTLRGDGTFLVGESTLAVTPGSDGSLLVSGDRQHVVWTAGSDARCSVFVEGEVYTLDGGQAARRPAARGSDHGPIASPMPATVRAIAVSAGDTVRRGDLLVVLEAMKMELPIRAAADGRVEAVRCREGELVQAGQELIEMAGGAAP